jgi:tRNA-specific 2-thiouridylase
MRKKALIAMSGGVDSSVAAHLMLERGYDCIGVTMKLFDGEDGRGALPKEKSCCALNDVNDARDVAYRLNIPHYVMNLRSEFE